MDWWTNGGLNNKIWHQYTPVVSGWQDEEGKWEGGEKELEGWQDPLVHTPGEEEFEKFLTTIPFPLNDFFLTG